MVMPVAWGIVTARCPSRKQSPAWGRTAWPADQVAHQVGENPLRLAADDDVDPWKCPVKGRTHGAIAVGSAEDDGERGVTALEDLGQDQGGNVLVERRREADHLGTDGANFVGHPLKERRDQAAHRQHRLQKTVLHLARPKEGQVLCVRLGSVTERRDGEDPISEPGVDRRTTASYSAMPIRDSSGRPAVAV